MEFRRVLEGEHNTTLSCRDDGSAGAGERRSPPPCPSIGVSAGAIRDEIAEAYARTELQFAGSEADIA